MNVICHARIKTLRSSIQLGLKRSMEKEETLGLEKLGLDKPAGTRNASRANRGKGAYAKDNAFLQSESQQAFGQHTSNSSSWTPSTAPSYQPLLISPLTEILNHWPSQIDHHGLFQHSPDSPRYHPLQTLISSPGLSSFAPIISLSTVRRETAAPFVPSELPSRGSESTVQKSTLSVLKYRALLSSRVDKQYRYSKANAPLTEAIPVQHGRWTGSPPANLRMAVSQPSRSSQSTKTRDLEATSHAIRRTSPSIINSKDDLIHLPAPVPTSAYFSNAHVSPKLLPSPQRLLLVLDLNGTLLYRPRASQKYMPRPCLAKFLKYAFANHSLLVWSSARPHNVRGVCTRLFSQDQREMLLGEWGRDTLGLTSAQYKERVQVYKRLDRIWVDNHFQHFHPGFELGQRWGQHNTVLIDDSALKASAQPFNHVEVPEFVRDGGEKEDDGRDVLGQVVGYLEEARKWSDVSGFVRHGPFEINEGWRWEWHKKKSQGRDQCEHDDNDGGVRL